MAEARPASTVVLLRPSPERFQVLLVRRHDTVAFMGGAHVFPGGRIDEADRADDVATRHRLAAARELREEAGIVIPPDVLVPFARWITPDIEITRYDTWFYMARMPAGQEAIHDPGELSDSLWIEPAAAIEMARRREIALPPPTWITLRDLAAFASVEQALAWARGVTVAAIQPVVQQRDGVKWLTVPTDGTQFVFANGRWTLCSGLTA